MRKHIILCLSVFFCLFALTGCTNVFTKNKGNKGNAHTQISPSYVTSVDAMATDTYYIMHQNEDGSYIYYRPYINEKTFSNIVAGSVDDKRILWFREDLGAVPTFYAGAGDKIVYKTNSPVASSYVLERFYDLGYTFGLYNMQRNSSGRFFLDVSNLTSLCESSNAYKLINFNTPELVFDTIGDAKLSAGNLGRGSTISNLKENFVYDVVVYRGSVRYKIDLKADTIAMSCCELYQLLGNALNGDFGLVEVPLPTWLNNGYYHLGGGGIFRYITGKSFDEFTDYNVPNQVVKEQSQYTIKNTTVEKPQNTEREDKVEKFNFSVAEEKEKKIIVNYVSTEEDTSVPVAKIIGSDSAWTLSKLDGEDTLQIIDTFPAGNYEIQVSGLNGRKVSVYTDTGN